MAGPLVSTDELARIIDRPDVIVVDCRWYLGEPNAGAVAYASGHLPRAVYASLDDDLSGPTGEGRHPLPDPETFAGTMVRFGVTPNSTVVAYDDRGGAVASRLWWMLTDQGHPNAGILDGGIQAWIAAGHDLSSVEPEPTRGRFEAKQWHGVVDRTAVACRHEAILVIDARSAERYAGLDEPVDPKAGHIPGALSLPLTDNLTEDLMFRSHAELRTRFRDAGIDHDGEVISQCGSGVTACHNILAMEVAGFGRPKLYVGSWSDWSSSDLPVATGSAP